jgi:hypothetical protein
MSNVKYYYKLCPLTSDPEDLTKQARAEAARTWECSECTSLKLGAGAIDAQISVSRIKDKPINFVTDGIGLALRSFLDQLGPDVVERDLHIGRVFGSDGEELKDWCTFYGRREVVVRGCDNLEDENDRAGYRVCRQCGRTLYFALEKPHYLCPSPPTDAEVFTDHCLALVVPDYLLAKLEIPKKSKIAVTRLEVLAEPLDGFGPLEAWEADRAKWGVRHESKRGYTRLTDSLLRQLKEDVDARNRGYYTSIFWHFFPDAETGRIEIAPDLLEAMEMSGIKHVLHK